MKKAKSKYKIEFVPAFKPYQPNDEWQIVQYVCELGGLPLSKVVYIGTSKEDCEKKLKEIKQ